MCELCIVKVVNHTINLFCLSVDRSNEFPPKGSEGHRLAYGPTKHCVPPAQG